MKKAVLFHELGNQWRMNVEHVATVLFGAYPLLLEAEDTEA